MKRSSANAGFTLVEILVVIAILSLLAGVVMVNVLPSLGMGNQAAAKTQIANFASALNTYRIAHGRFPTEEQGLDALVRAPTVSPVPKNYPAGGYLASGEVPQDPWGRAYVYLVPGRQDEPFEVLSYGADGMEGGSGEDADLSSSHP